MKENASMLHRVKDLSPEQRQAAEVLLGHAVAEDEMLSIKRLQSSTAVPSRLSPTERMDALNLLNDRLSGPSVNSDVENDAVNEAIRSVRPNYRSTG